MGLYEERLERVKAAVRLEQVDKIPILSGGPAAMAAYEKVILKDYINDMELNCSTNIEFINDFNMDGTQAPIFSPRILYGLWFSEVRAPGDGVVPDNELWQVEESERMTQEDYDKILEMGFGAWSEAFLKEQYGDAPNAAASYFAYYPTALKRFYEAGIPSFVDNTFASPLEQICGARSLEAFVMDDLMDIPEKVTEAFDHIHKYNMERYENSIKDPATRPNGVWIGGWRGTPSMLSPNMFQQFSWKYMKEYIDLCIQYDVIPLCHLDSNWDLGLSNFLELPPKKMIISFDGATDIFKAKKILGEHSCLMGDVRAEMLAFSKTEDVYNYCMKLVKEVGPTGYIMCSGCDVPFNANFDNVRQMQKSVENYSREYLNWKG